jgi:alpha-glutamyl/putrescinyl thymine pyrophosphorylase clade 1
MDRLTPRPEIMRIYWTFTAERQKVFERRVAGRPGPWTDDPILQEFKFCNVYRAADRVSQYLIRDVVYASDTSDARDTLFQIVAFRLFSKTETWEAVRSGLGRPPTLDDLRDGSFGAALEGAKRDNGTLYTGAFILCANDAYGHGEKYLNHVALLRYMFLEDRAADRVVEAASLRDIFEILKRYPLLGDFMAYQIAIDLNYSAHVNFSENDFTCPGPGALRGIAKTFTDLGGYSKPDVIMWMVEHQDEQFERHGLDFDGLWGRPLHAIDCQNLFCEVDKYCRKAVPELTSARTKIKRRFTPAVQGLQLFFPPKWGINEKLPRESVLGGSGVGAAQESLF